MTVGTPMGFALKPQNGKMAGRQKFFPKSDYIPENLTLAQKYANDKNPQF